jgi:hypothetical protein
MLLKIPFLSQGFEIVNFLNPVVESQLFTSFVKQIPPMAFWHQARSDKCLFQLPNPGLTFVSLLESEYGFENCHATRGHRKSTIFTSLAYDITPFRSWAVLVRSHVFTDPTFKSYRKIDWTNASFLEHSVTKKLRSICHYSPLCSSYTSGASIHQFLSCIFI